MLRFIYVILLNLFRAPYMIPKMRREADHPEKYSAEERYELARHCIRLMKVTGGIHTKAYGQENLPKEGGYMMYPNHQGKYDALGIVYTHRKPCSIVMDKAKSNTILVKEFIDLLEGKRLDKKDVRQALTIINEVSEDVKNGKCYILFPEGGYDFNNRNHVCDFKAGSFKIALKTKAPIIPVALIDSYSYLGQQQRHRHSAKYHGRQRNRTHLRNRSGHHRLRHQFRIRPLERHAPQSLRP